MMTIFDSFQTSNGPKGPIFLTKKGVNPKTQPPHVQLGHN